MSRGFTLIELMIAIGILTAGMLGILGVLTAASRSQRAAMDDCISATVAETVVADIRRACAFGEGPDDVSDARCEFDPRYSYSVETMLLDKHAGEYFVVVKVNWLRRGHERAREFPTIVVSQE